MNSLASLGLAATCNSGGAGQWGSVSDASPLAGRDAVIIADKDAPGRRHAQDVARRLKGTAKTVKIIEMPGTHKDVSDWLESAAAKPPEVRRALLKMMSEGEKEYAPTEPGCSVTVGLSDVEPREVRWLWPTRIALGKLTILAGDPGLGKSFVTLDIAARVSRGDGFPGFPDAASAPGGVALLNAEDDLADTIRPRLDAADADVSRIRALTAVLEHDGGETRRRAFNLAEDLKALDETIRGLPDCRLVIVDPISAYLGGMDSHKNSDMRSVLAPLSELAAEHDVAVIGVTHLRKGEGPAIYRTMGSLAFVAAARAAYFILRDKSDPTGRTRLFVPVKNNLGSDSTGLSFTLETPGDLFTHPRVAWGATLDVGSDDAMRSIALAAAPRARESEWILDILKDGPVDTREILDRAASAGISERTLRRAKVTLGIGHLRKDGAWHWTLKREAQ